MTTLAPETRRAPAAFPMGLLAILLMLDCSGWLLGKFASARAEGEGWALVANLWTHPWAWIALAVGPLQLWVWTRILAVADISLAFPLTSLAYPLTIGVSVLLFHERLPLQVWIGVGLITAGAAILHAGREDEPKMDALDTVLKEGPP